VLVRVPPIEPPPSRYAMPSPEMAPAHGCLAGGGDLEPGTILAAYRRGIFPVAGSRGATVVVVAGSARRAAARRVSRIAQPAAYASARPVSRHAGSGLRRRDRRLRGAAEGSWITPAMPRAYERLHALGWVHSVEAWQGRLVGGRRLRRGDRRLFAAESKFHRVTDASKVALAALVEWLAARRFQLLDVQLPTDHLRRLGVIEMPRREYLRRLARGGRGRRLVCGPSRGRADLVTPAALGSRRS
jgi:leucyl/phenylalanyl-tRNA--protein transferase